MICFVRQHLSSLQDWWWFNQTNHSDHWKRPNHRCCNQLRCWKFQLGSASDTFSLRCQRSAVGRVGYLRDSRVDQVEWSVVKLILLRSFEPNSHFLCVLMTILWNGGTVVWWYDPSPMPYVALLRIFRTCWVWLCWHVSFWRSETMSCLSCCKYKNMENHDLWSFSLKKSDYGSWPKQHETEVRLVSRPIHSCMDSLAA